MRSKRVSAKLLIASTLFLLGARLAADTPWSGNITTSTTWTLANSPYVVTGTVVVGGAGSPVLTIEPGVTVKFNPGALLSIGSGSPGNLTALGTQTSPIVMTSSAVSPAAGNWAGLHIMSQATSATQLAWVTVRYAGTGSSGGIRIQGPAATLTRVTSRDHLFAALQVESGSPILSTCTLSYSPWGVRITGGSPTLNSSTAVSNNTAGGIFLDYPGTVSLQTISITANTGYAVSQNPKITLGTVSSVTATGNTTNAVELRSGPPVDVNTTWKKLLYYVVANGISVGGASTPVLTISAGATLKFSQNTGLSIAAGSPARLVANGTASQPIILTANTTSPSPGYWSGVQFLSYTTSNSKLSYATLSYGGNGIYVQQSSPSIENVGLQNNSTGINLFQATPKIVNCSFSGNTSGLTNSSPTTIVTAGLNYWNLASGPSGSGPGTGQSVSTGVIYEPWLIAAPTTPNFLNTFLHTNRTFNPSISINTKLASGSAQSATWTTTILTTGGATVRTYTGTGTTWNVVWDGKDGGGVDQPNGTYNYQVQTGTSAIAKGLTIIDRDRALTMTGPTTAPAFFSPNGDAVQDTALTTSSFNFDDVAWTLTIKNAGGTTVRTVTGTSGGLSFAWDGKNGSGTTQPDGLYTITVSGIDGTASVNGSSSTTLDRTLPTATITAPAAGTTLSNIYQSGSTAVTIVGTASDTNVDHWNLDNLGFSSIATGTTNVTASALGTWATLSLTNQGYTVQLKVWDKAGNTTTVSRAYTVGNFKVTLSGSQFNGSAGGTITLTSIVPFTLTETLFIRNQAGQTVRTIVNGTSRAAGTYNDTWDGRNGSAVLQPDGGYFSIATVTAGTYNMTLDSTPQPGGGGPFIAGHTHGSTFDPFNNQPLEINYNFAVSGRVSIAFSPDAHIVENCPPPDFCVIFDQYTSAGPQTYYWAGVDSTGRYRPEAKFIEVVLKTTSSSNTIVLYGTKVLVTGVGATPIAYSPPAGNQSITFTIATYQSLPANVTITFLNQESMSVLRTINLTSQSAGPHTVAWDGRADNGMWVAPGSYLVTVSATDSLTNSGVGQIMTRVTY